MGIANDYYRILEEESQKFYQDIDEAKQKTLQTKFMRGSIKTLSNLGINPMLAGYSTLIGSLFGGKKIAESRMFEKILKDHPGAGEFLDAAALSPYLLLRMGNLAENLKSHKQEQNYFVKGNNWQDYDVKTQSLHALRTISKLANTGSLLGIAGGILTGNSGLASAAASISPFMLNSYIGSGITHLTGAALSGGMHAVSGLLSSFGASGVSQHLSNIGDWINSFINGTGGSILGASIGNILIAKAMQNLTPKTASIINVVPLNEPGLPQLMMTSTYKVYSNTIRMLQGQGLLKPSESLMLSILNDINLNTHALIPIYGKFLGNSKEVIQQQHINTWGALFNDDPENYTKFKARKFGLTEGDFNIRKAMFKTLTSAELWAESLLYKIPGAKYLTGMSEEEFEEKRKDLLFGNDNKARAEETASLKTGISLSTIRLLNTKADKWLNAPDYESRMLGLTAGIYEFTRFIAQHTGKSQEALNIYNKTLDQLNYRDMINYEFMLDEEKEWYQKIPIISKTFDLLNPVNIVKDFIITPYKAIKNIKSHFKKNLGLADAYEILETYESNKNTLKSNFDIKKSAEMYLGKYLPDHMTQIIHYLKTISINIKDILKCWNCNITKVKSSSSKWRGRYGEYMDGETFDKKIKADAYRLTRSQLGIKVRSKPTGLSGIAAKLMGINKETLNEDNIILKTIFEQDFFKSKKVRTADEQQEQLKKEKEVKETEDAIKKTPTILEKIYNFFKKGGLTQETKEETKKEDTTGLSGFSIFDLLKIPKWFKKLPKGIRGLLTGVFKLSKKILIPLTLIGTDILKQLPITSKIIGKLSKLYHMFMDKLKTSLNTIKNFLQKEWIDLKKGTKSIWDKVKTKAGNLWDMFTSQFKKGWQWTSNKFFEATDLVKKKISSTWEIARGTIKKVLGKFKEEAEKFTKQANKFIPTKEDIKILTEIIKEKLPKWLIRKEGEHIATRFMASVGTTLASAAAGGLPGILMVLADVVIWGDLVWEVYKFIKNEYFKATGKSEKNFEFTFKSKKLNFKNGSDFIESVEKDKHALVLYENNLIKDTVNFSTSNLYKFLKKGGSIEELQNIYINAKKFNRLENDKEDEKRVKALINLSKSGKLKNIKNEKQLEQLINDEIKKEQDQAYLHGKVQANVISEQVANAQNLNTKDLKEITKHLQENVAVSAQGANTIVQLLSNLSNIMHTLTQIESDSNQALKQIQIPDLSRA